ncbi:MAG: transposase [Pseudonocardia sp.]
MEVGGHGVVSHAGSVVLRLLADNIGLTATLSTALARRGFIPVHDRGRVVVDTAVCIADGGRVLSDMAALRDQGELYGSVASDPTLWRALEEIGADQRERIATARARARRHVWAQIEARHGQIPPSWVADVDLGKTVVIRMDATIQISHSDKEKAAGTFKGTFGHHRLAAWCDNTGEALALRLRPGNAGSNTASDHIVVLTDAIAQVPARHHRNLLITVDGAGSTLDLIGHITTLNTVPRRRVHYSVGFDLDHRGRTAIGKVPEQVWDQVWDRDGAPRDPDDAGVVELTGLLRASVGGDALANWPADMRIFCRRERPGSGAQLCALEETDGWRYQLCATNTPGKQPALLEARHRVHARVEDRAAGRPPA